MSQQTNRLEVDNLIPFATTVYWWLKVNDLGLDNLAKDSRRYEHPYLAWEIVRKRKNPFFEKGTGFEGYYVGICHSPEEVLQEIIRVCQDILTSIGRQYRMEYGFRTRLMKTLTGETADPKAINIWSSFLGATVARLRCNVRRNHQADVFRAETYRMVQSMPLISYYCLENEHAIEQVYSLSLSGVQNGHRIQVDWHNLKPADQEAWLVARCIGRFGHPIIRELLDMR